MLSNSEKAHFESQGWVGPYPLLNKTQVANLTKAHAASVTRFTTAQDILTFTSDAPLPKPWHKSLHAYLPEFRELVQYPGLVERVASILGPDVIAWGVSVTVRRPGQVHRWHVDIEHWRWRGISAFIGLTGTSAQSTLQVIPHSHRFDVMPQVLGAEDDNSALAEARKIYRDSEVISIPLGEGDFFLFEGRLWHGSANVGKATRSAVIAQFTVPTERVAVPSTYGEPIRWHSSRPPCVLVKGRDTGRVNYLV